MIEAKQQLDTRRRSPIIKWSFPIVAIAVGIAFTLLSPMPLHAQASISDIDVADKIAVDSPVCRLGVNVERAPIDAFDTAPLRLGWYIDYQARAVPARPQGVNYAPMIRLTQTGEDSYSTKPTGQKLEETVLAHAGQETTWFIGNEPDRIKWQDEIMPAVYAKAFHELYEQIKTLDPSAKIVAGSIVQATEVRMDYLDLILASHQEQYGEPMIVDAWAAHGFILREASCAVYPLTQCWGAEIPPGVDADEGLLIDVQQNDDFDIFTENIVRMRKWMADNGYRNTPLYLSEYGVLMPGGRFTPDFTPARVNEFMTKSFDYILTDGVDEEIGYPQDGNRLVQYLSWYSTSDNRDFNGYLYDLENDNQLSLMGENYAAEAATISDDFDFMPLTMTVESPIVVMGQGEDQKALLVVGVNIANAGNNFHPQTALVRLYDGDPDAGGIALADGATAVVGCGKEGIAYVIVTLPWNSDSNLPPESLGLYAYVNPDETVDEVEMGNNTLAHTLFLGDTPVVTVDTRGFLPLVSR